MKERKGEGKTKEERRKCGGGGRRRWKGREESDKNIRSRRKGRGEDLRKSKSKKTRRRGEGGDEEEGKDGRERGERVSL